jgi:CMP-N-acetylneuraminic acid synthetase
MEKPKLVQGVAQENKINTDAKKVEASKVETKVITKSPKAESQGMTQREAVFVEVMRTIRDEKIVFTDGQSVKPLLNETQIKRICAALVASFQSKKVILKDTESNNQKLKDSKLMELYCLGLLNNWLRRDARLNGTLNRKN